MSAKKKKKRAVVFLLYFASIGRGVKAGLMRGGGAFVVWFGSIFAAVEVVFSFCCTCSSGRPPRCGPEEVRGEEQTKRSSSYFLLERFFQHTHARINAQLMLLRFLSFFVLSLVLFAKQTLHPTFVHWLIAVCKCQQRLSYRG